MPPQVWISSPAEHRARPPLHSFPPSSPPTSGRLALSPLSSSSCTSHPSLLLGMLDSPPAKPFMDALTTGRTHAHLGELKAEDLQQPGNWSPTSPDGHSSTHPHSLASKSKLESSRWAHQVDKPARLIIRFVIWICSDLSESKKISTNTETACCLVGGCVLCG